MALIILTNGKAVPVTPAKGATIWRVMTGELRGSEQQRRFCKTVKKVYLNPDNAPESYLRRHAPPEPVISLPYKD